MDNNLINSEVYKIDKNDFLENAEHLKNALDTMYKELENLTTFIEGEEADKDGNILINEDTENKEVLFNLPLLTNISEAMFTYIFELHLKSKINNVKNIYDKGVITKQSFDLYEKMKNMYFDKFLNTLKDLNFKLCIFLEVKNKGLYINLFSYECGHGQLNYTIDDSIIDHNGQIKLNEKTKEEFKELLLENIKPIITQFKGIHENLKYDEVLIITEQEALNKLIKPKDLF